MAKALIQRARERRDWIGDDHGDPYEEALVAGEISPAISIAFKEIVEHLRSSLDYCAYETCSLFGSTAGKIYFPIAGLHSNSTQFAKLAKRVLPGVTQSRPDLIRLFESFQHFASPENAWLPALATLSNQTKHVDLVVNEVSALRYTVWRESGGKLLSRAVTASGRNHALRSLGLITDLDPLPDSNDSTKVGGLRQLWIPMIDRELVEFVDDALIGSDRVVDAIAEACHPTES